MRWQLARCSRFVPPFAALQGRLLEDAVRGAGRPSPTPARRAASRVTGVPETEKLGRGGKGDGSSLAVARARLSVGTLLWYHSTAEAEAPAHARSRLRPSNRWQRPVARQLGSLPRTRRRRSASAKVAAWQCSCSRKCGCPTDLTRRRTQTRERLPAYESGSNSTE